MNHRALALSALLSLSPVLARSQAQPAADPEPAAGAAAAPAAGHKKQPETLLEFAIAGGWMMIPLSICSVLSIAFLIERLIVLRRKVVLPPELVARVQALVRDRPLDRDAARAAVNAHPSTAATVLQAALDRADLPLEKIEKGVQNVAAQQTYKLRDHIWIFAVISTTAPLLGLLGTVIGLVQAFREVAISGLGAGATLAPGIYEALIATVGGLFTAIPAVAVYYWLHSMVDRYVHEIDALVVDLVEACGTYATTA
jgi:biopolymer transport protein ExbB